MAPAERQAGKGLALLSAVPGKGWGSEKLSPGTQCDHHTSFSNSKTSPRPDGRGQAEEIMSLRNVVKETVT